MSFGKGKLKEAVGNGFDPNTGSLCLILNACDTDLESLRKDTELSGILSKKWSVVKTDMKLWASDPSKYKLGNLTTTLVQSTSWVVHCLVLDKGKSSKESVEKCFKNLAELSKYEGGTVHISKQFLDLVPETKDCVNVLLDKGVNVFLYKN
jgi:hypothetical protein